jgi:hypothetical protein
VHDIRDALEALVLQGIDGVPNARLVVVRGPELVPVLCSFPSSAWLASQLIFPNRFRSRSAR